MHGTGVLWSLPDRAKHIDQSVYNVICEIENVMTYEELRTVFQSLTGFPTAQGVEGRIRHVNAGSLITSTIEVGRGALPTMSMPGIPWPSKTSRWTISAWTGSFSQKDEFPHNIEIKSGFASRRMPPGPWWPYTQVSEKFHPSFHQGRLVHGATDIHIFPLPTQDIYKIRFRLLGDLVDVHTLKPKRDVPLSTCSSTGQRK